MYITITPQKLGGNYLNSVSDFVAYLEKENKTLEEDQMEHFFDQNGEEIRAGEVIKNIDANTTKLKRKEPKFYSITLNPSKRELDRIQNSPEALKRYTRAAMEVYAKAFNREIDGRAVTVKDILYYAKVERQRTYKGSDREIKENQPYATQILKLKQEIRRLEQGQGTGNPKTLQKEINRLEREAPHQLNGKRIVQGMPKPGHQGHVHIIVSRKDASNRFSLSPGSKYKASEVEINGKLVKRGFDRDSFFKNAEKTFDTLFKYQRNYVETYAARKTFAKNPKLYFSMLSRLPTNERVIAFKLLSQAGVSIPKIPTNKVQLTLKAINRIKKGLDRAIQSGSIGI